MCVCVLRVLARFRDAEAGVTFVLGTVAVVGGNRCAPMPFWDFSIAGLPWNLGVRRMWRLELGLSPDRCRQGLDVLFGPQTANRNNEAASDGGTFTVTNEYFLPHVREVDTPTLSPEFQ